MEGHRFQVKHFKPSDLTANLKPKTKGCVFVAVYSPQCGHCHALKQAWEEFSNSTGGCATVGAIDGSAHPNLASKLGVIGFPTIFMFNGDKRVDISSTRSVKGLIKACKTYCQTCQRI